jgi:hypothetical protein
MSYVNLRRNESDGKSSTGNLTVMGKKESTISRLMKHRFGLTMMRTRFNESVGKITESSDAGFSCYL